MILPEGGDVGFRGTVGIAAVQVLAVIFLVVVKITALITENGVHVDGSFAVFPVLAGISLLVRTACLLAEGNINTAIGVKKVEESVILIIKPAFGINEMIPVHALYAGVPVSGA